MEYKLIFFAFSFIYAIAIILRARKNKDLIGNKLNIIPYLILVLSIIFSAVVIYNG